MSETPLVFTLRNHLEALAAVTEQIEQALAPLHLSTREAYAIRLVLDESLSNTINHGYADDAPHEIRIELRIKPEEIALTIEDDGIAFDPLAAAPPALDDTVEERPIGGLGIHLTRSVMDECHYSRTSGRNRLMMRKKKSLGPNAGAPQS